MYEKDKATIINRYNDRFKKHGGEIGTLAVGNMERQFVRFDVLAQIGDLKGKSVLDVGCGFGDFYGFLLSKGIECDYTGYDMNPTLVDVAVKKYPSAKFRVLDFLTDKCADRFDYVVSSTTFNNKFTELDNYDMIAKVLGRAFEMSRLGVSINLMTDYVDYKEDYAFYYSPERVFKMCKAITSRVALRHDYGMYEFTLYLYKGECDWKIKEKGGK
jgi:SAM-dependent methyltransferase